MKRHRISPIRIRRDSRHQPYPKLEPLEERLLLSGLEILELDPPQNSQVAELGSEFNVRFNHNIDPGSVTDSSVIILGMQSGQVQDHSDIYAVTADTISINPGDRFHAGEHIQITLSTDIQSTRGDTLDRYYSWLFRTGTTSSSGVFVDSGQRLGDSLSNAAALADLDGDGDLDAFVATGGGQPNEVWFNDGHGQFTESNQVLASTTSESVLLGDLDGDGDVDAFVQDTTRSRVWINDGSGRFIKGQRIYARARLFQARSLGDTNGDGDLDVFMGDMNHLDGSDGILANQGDATFTGQGGLWLSYDADFGDLDADGDLDFVTAFPFEVGYVYYNEPGGYKLHSWDFHPARMRVTLGDIDGDHDLDIFAAERLWRNDGNRTYSLRGSPTSYQEARVQLGDVDGDGDLDAFIGRNLSRNNGSGGFSGVSATTASQTIRVGLGDLDDDGDLDVFDPYSGTGNRVLFNGSVPNQEDPAGNVVAERKRRRLVIRGDNFNNHVTVASPGRRQLIVTGMNGTKVNGQTEPLTFDKIKNGVSIYLGHGRDAVTITGTRRIPGSISIDTHTGDDEINLLGIKASNVMVDSGKGDDIIIARDSILSGMYDIESRGGRDSIHLDRSVFDDVLVNTGGARDLLKIDDSVFEGVFRSHTGSGNDRISIEIGRSATGPPSIFRKTAVIKSGAGDDRIEIGSKESGRWANFKGDGPIRNFSLIVSGGSGSEVLDMSAFGNKIKNRLQLIGIEGRRFPIFV